MWVIALPLHQNENRLPVGPGGGCCLTPSYSIALRGGREIAELLEIRFLRLVAWRQLEQARRGAAHDVVLALLRHERQVPDGCGQVEVPVWIVRRGEQL